MCEGGGGGGDGGGGGGGEVTELKLWGIGSTWRQLPTIKVWWSRVYPLGKLPTIKLFKYILFT